MLTLRANTFETNSSSSHSVIMMKHSHVLTPKEIQKQNKWLDKRQGDERTLLLFGCEDINNYENYYGDAIAYFERYPFGILSTFYDKCRYASAEFGEKRWKEIKQIILENDDRFDDVILPTDTQTAYINPVTKEVLKYCNCITDLTCKTYMYYEEEDVHQRTARTRIITRSKKGDIIDAEKIEMPCKFTGSIDHQSQGLLSRFMKSNDVDLKDFLLNTRYVVIIDGDEYDTWGKLKVSGIIDTDNIQVEENIFSRY